MTIVFDFSKESNDYRQRIAVVFRSLFEKEFLENFDIVLEELFKGNYSIELLKEAIKKSKHLLQEGESVHHGVIRKDKENEKFSNKAIRVIILLMVLGEEYTWIKDEIEVIRDSENLISNMKLLRDIIDNIEKERYLLGNELRHAKFSISEIDQITVVLKDIEDIFIGRCEDIKTYIEEVLFVREDVDQPVKEIGVGIIKRINNVSKEKNKIKNL
ncbi:MAG: hypothetical protein J6Y29_06425 [Clostridiales bacterium]|nr:hypothetical protein [Clostridiales bacterium]